jgi:hypothetical protein
MAKKLLVMVAALGFMAGTSAGQDANTIVQKAISAMVKVTSIQYSGTGHDYELGQNFRPTTPWTKLIVTRYTRASALRQWPNWWIV